MLLYIIEVVLWTLIIFSIFEIGGILINKFVINTKELKKIFSKTISEDKKI